MKKAPIKDVVMTAVAAEEAPAQEPPRWLVLSLQILAYGIPLTFLAYVLYINYLPFGYDKTFTIDVGVEGDTDSRRDFYLEPSRNLSEQRIAEDGTTYRNLDNVVFAIFNPTTMLREADITIGVTGSGIEIIPPFINLDPGSINWDYAWDFTNNKSLQELGFIGQATPLEDSMYFDGTNRLELPNSADNFESGPISIYVEWVPTNSSKNFQQIVGHYNWEISQFHDSVRFTVGEMNSENIRFFSVRFPIESPEFFNNKHYLLAIYSPSKSDVDDGYISLYVDGLFAGYTPLDGLVLDVDYWDKSLSLGKNWHKDGEYYDGTILDLRIVNEELNFANTSHTIESRLNIEYRFALISDQDNFLDKITLNKKK